MESDFNLKEVQDLLIEQWDKTKNPNAYLLYRFLELYPNFLTLEVKRGEPSKEGFTLKKPLFERMVNKMMSSSKNDGGKKLKNQRLLRKSLDQLSSQLNLSVPQVLALLLIRTVPNYTVRRLKYGSGYLTKLAHLTFAKKISWFLKIFILSSRKRNKPFSESFKSQVQMVFSKNTKGVYYTQKREQQISAVRANLQ